MSFGEQSVSSDLSLELLRESAGIGAGTGIAPKCWQPKKETKNDISCENNNKTVSPGLTWA